MKQLVVCIYLLYLEGATLFIDKRANYVNVTYLMYFRDLELVTHYAWKAATLTHL
jgi:hypothetical protein